jgi:hypothetical protein
VKENCPKMKLQKSNKWTKLYPEAKTSVTQQPTIAVDGGLPVQYIIQAPNFAKLRKNPSIYGRSGK